jgi:adenosine deaminase
MERETIERSHIKTAEQRFLTVLEQEFCETPRVAQALLREGQTMDWTALPKVELHLHLDCSLSYGVVSRIEPSITLEDHRTEYAKLHTTFGWGPREFCRCNRNALQVAFIPDDLCETLLARLAASYHPP